MALRTPPPSFIAIDCFIQNMKIPDHPTPNPPHLRTHLRGCLKCGDTDGPQGHRPAEPDSCSKSTIQLAYSRACGCVWKSTNDMSSFSVTHKHMCCETKHSSTNISMVSLVNGRRGGGGVMCSIRTLIRILAASSNNEVFGWFCSGSWWVANYINSVWRGKRAVDKLCSEGWESKRTQIIMKDSIVVMINVRSKD